MRGFMSSSSNNESKPSSEKPIGDNMSSISSAQPSPIPTPASSVAGSQTHPSTPAKTSTPTAIIGPKIRFKGELAGEEDLLIQGQVDGTIDLKNNTLTIGEQGVVKANVHAKTITIQGTVEGDLFGQERISILASSNVKGNIVADSVILEDGAKFRGSIDMDIDAHKDKFQGQSSHSNAAAGQNTTKASPQDDASSKKDTNKS